MISATKCSAVKCCCVTCRFSWRCWCGSRGFCSLGPSLWPVRMFSSWLAINRKKNDQPRVVRKPPCPCPFEPRRLTKRPNRPARAPDPPADHNPRNPGRHKICRPSRQSPTNQSTIRLSIRHPCPKLTAKARPAAPPRVSSSGRLCPAQWGATRQPCKPAPTNQAIEFSLADGKL